MITFEKEKSSITFLGDGKQTLVFEQPKTGYLKQVLYSSTTTSGGSSGTPLGLLLVITTTSGGTTTTTYEQHYAIKTSTSKQTISLNNNSYTVKV